MGFRGVLGPRVRRRRRVRAARRPPRGRRDQLRLPALRHLHGRLPDALPQPHRPRHPQPRRRVRRPHRGPAGEPAPRCRTRCPTTSRSSPSRWPRRIRFRRSCDRARRSRRGARRRPPGQPVRPGAGGSVGSRARGRQAPREAGAAAARGIATALVWPTLTTPRMADIVVDCTGSATGLPTALTTGAPARHHRAQDHGGRLAEAGLGAVRHRRGDAGRLAVRPVRPRARGLARGQVDVLPLISDRFDLSNGLAALERAQAPGVLKVLLDVASA